MVALKLFSQDEYLLPTTSKPLIYLRFLKSYNYTPTISIISDRMKARKRFVGFIGFPPSLFNAKPGFLSRSVRVVLELSYHIHMSYIFSHFSHNLLNIQKNECAFVSPQPMRIRYFCSFFLSANLLRINHAPGKTPSSANAPRASIRLGSLTV